MSGYVIDVQAGLALSASWRHPEVLKHTIAGRVFQVKSRLKAGCGQDRPPSGVLIKIFRS